MDSDACAWGRHWELAAIEDLNSVLAGARTAESQSDGMVTTTHLGASLDALSSDRIWVYEIKCPYVHRHHQDFPLQWDHFAQLQMQMAMAGAAGGSVVYWQPDHFDPTADEWVGFKIAAFAAVPIDSLLPALTDLAVDIKHAGSDADAVTCLYAWRAQHEIPGTGVIYRLRLAYDVARVQPPWKPTNATSPRRGFPIDPA